MNDKIAIKPFEQEPRKNFSKKFRAELFQELCGICYLCECKIDSGDAWQIEHEKALSLGGTNERFNLKLVHDICHKPKTKSDIQGLVKPRRLNVKHSQPKKESKMRSNAKIQSRGFAKKVKIPIKYL